MSLESAKAFFERFKSDEAFRNSLKDADEDQTKAILEQAGFEFTQEEYDEVTAQLSDEDLGMVSGGQGPEVWGKGLCVFVYKP
jgi:predicted ribosomally synthesized peptide with nif11-like leader